jgi:pentatricopeptide repeat protein
MIKGMKKQTRFIPAEQAYLSIFTWLEELQENKIQVDCVLYNCIMDVCIMYRDIEKALEVYEMMNKVDIEPNYVTFGILIKA